MVNAIIKLEYQGLLQPKCLGVRFSRVPQLADAVGLLLGLGPPGDVDNPKTNTRHTIFLRHILTREWDNVKMLLA